MAILKYTDSNGVTHGVNSYKINPVIVKQEAGESETDVMSQKAVSQADAELTQRIDDEVSTLNEEIGKKANSSDVYDKTAIDGMVSQVNTAVNSKLPIDSFNEWSESVATKTEVNAKANANDVYDKTAIDGKVDDINTAINAKANASTTYTKDEVDSAIEDYFEDLEVINAGEY